MIVKILIYISPTCTTAREFGMDVKVFCFFSLTQCLFHILIDQTSMVNAIPRRTILSSNRYAGMPNVGRFPDLTLGTMRLQRADDYGIIEMQNMGIKLQNKERSKNPILTIALFPIYNSLF